MLFERTKAKQKLQEALARTPITILATPAGTGKSRLIDSIFEVNGRLDTNSCVMVRFDERVNDLDTFARIFASALNHDLPDDVSPHDFILTKIKELPKGHIIVLDDLHLLANQGKAMKFIIDLIEHSGTFDPGFGRRWLLGTRDINDFPYILWHAKGACTSIAGSNDLSLQSEEIYLFKSNFNMSSKKHLDNNVRNLIIHASKVLLGKKHPHAIFQQAMDAQDTTWTNECDSESFGHKCICGLEKDITTGNSHKECHLSSYTLDLYKLLSSLDESLGRAILSCSLMYNLNSDMLIDDIKNIDQVMKIMCSLDLAHVDLATNQMKIDGTVRKALQKILNHSSRETIYVSAKVACKAGFSQADVFRAFKLLIHKGMWKSIESLLSEYGFDLFERDQVNGIISHIVSEAPHEISTISPVIAGFTGIVNSRVNFTDACESDFRCALESDSLNVTLRRKFQYRYALEIARRSSSDDRKEAADYLQALLKQAYSEEGFDIALQALIHSLSAMVDSRVNPSIAMGHIDRAMSAISQIDDAWTRARIYNDCAYASLHIRQYDNAISLATDSVRISRENGFHDLASRTFSILQDIAYRYLHSPSRSIHYLQCMSHHAERAGESRMLLLSWLGRHWLAAEAARPHDIEEAQNNIHRYLSPDDYMQTQVQSCTVPAAAMIKAWKGEFLEAIKLVESYATHETDPESRAFRWSELCIYIAGHYLSTGDITMKARYKEALHEVRAAMRDSSEDILQEASVAFRVAISLFALKRNTAARALIKYIDSLSESDQRAPLMSEVLKCLIGFKAELGQGRPLGRAMRNLHSNDLGGVAFLIDALPISCFVPAEWL